MNKVVALAIAIGAVLVVWLLFVLIRYLQERLWLVGRPEAGLEPFLAHFERLGLPTELAHAVYCKIRSDLTVSRSFGVLPSDSLQAEFDVDRFGGVALEELIDDLLWEYARIKLTDEQIFEAISVFGSVCTVEELVRLLHHIISQSPTQQHRPSL